MYGASRAQIAVDTSFLRCVIFKIFVSFLKLIAIKANQPREPPNCKCVQCEKSGELKRKGLHRFLIKSTSKCTHCNQSIKKTNLRTIVESCTLHFPTQKYLNIFCSAKRDVHLTKEPLPINMIQKELKLSRLKAKHQIPIHPYFIHLSRSTHALSHYIQSNYVLVQVNYVTLKLRRNNA